MFKIFKSDLINSNEFAQDDKKELKDVVRISNNDDILRIEILTNISVLEYQKLTSGSDVVNLPLKVFIMEGYSFFTSTLLPQTIYIYREENKVYYVTDSNKYLQVVESITSDEINEIILKMDKCEKCFKITKEVHDLSLSTKICKVYPLEQGYIEGLSLEKMEAFNITKELIKRVGEVKKLDKIANVYDLYKYTNIIDEEYFHPITGDDVISISKMFVSEGYNVSQEKDQFFDIILNETGEKIGELTFTLYADNFRCEDNSIRYEGNVSYSILPRYQSNHYATRALKLLVQLIRENTTNNDKTIYISTLPDNIYSQKVALNNGATFFYEGDVPEDKTLNSIDGVKQVKIYKIQM